MSLINRGAIVIIFSIFFACSESEQDVNSLFKRFYKFKLEINPVEATKGGENEYNDYIENYISDDYVRKTRSGYRQFLEQIGEIDTTNLSETDKISLAAMRWDCEIKLEGLNNDLVTIASPVFDLPHFQLMPLFQISSFQLYVGQMASGASIQPFNSVKDYENWLKRSQDYIVWLEQAEKNMREGIREGIMPPKILIERTISQLIPFAEYPIEEHVFYGPVQRFPDSFSQDEKEILTIKFREMIDEIKSANQSLLVFMESEYLPAGRDSDGIDALPNGPETYQYLIKYHTTTNMTPNEIFELGKGELERISQEMEKVKEAVGFEGDLKSFFDFVRNRDELRPYDQPEQVIEHFTLIQATVESNVGNLFNLTPKGSFEVRRTEAFREASASAEYVPGSKDATRPGIFYVPIPNVAGYNILTDQALFLHEAIPGHHYQLSLQQENQELPEFLHAEGMGVYVEGWALYSESLGNELGLYTDPYQYFGMLTMEMHRAIRLVVDAGIHSQGWTREQAIQYSLDHEAESLEGITSEIERYMAVPGQALSYKIVS